MDNPEWRALPKAQEPVSFVAVAEGQGKHTCRSIFTALCGRPVAGGETNAFRRVSFREKPPEGQGREEIPRIVTRCPSAAKGNRGNLKCVNGERIKRVQRNRTGEYTQEKGRKR